MLKRKIVLIIFLFTILLTTLGLRAMAGARAFGALSPSIVPAEPICPSVCPPPY